MISWASLVAQLVKNLPAVSGDVKDIGSTLGSGRFPGVGTGELGGVVGEGEGRRHPRQANFGGDADCNLWVRCSPRPPPHREKSAPPGGPLGLRRQTHGDWVQRGLAELLELLEPWLDPRLLPEWLLCPQWQTQRSPCLGPTGASSELGFIFPALALFWQNQYPPGGILP